MLVIDNKFDFGQIVYLITDEEQKERMVVQIRYDGDSIMYALTLGTDTSIHYEREISETKKL